MDGGAGLRVEHSGHVLTLTLDRPEHRNALTVSLVSALVERIAAARDEDVRVIVLRGGPPVFCAGGDLADLGGLADRGGPLAVTDAVYRHFHRLVGELGSTPVPVVAALDGAALGAGLDLALACDLRIATTRSTFASSWIGVGLVPGMGGAYLLQQAIGTTRAREMVLLGEPVDAAVALDWGLVNRAVEPESFEAALAVVVERLLELPAAALERSKASLHRSATAGLATELATLGAVQGSLLTGEDFRARTARFRRRS